MGDSACRLGRRYSAPLARRSRPGNGHSRATPSRSLAATIQDQPRNSLLPALLRVALARPVYAAPEPARPRLLFDRASASVQLVPPPARRLMRTAKRFDEP